jgi:hypothetical protein
MPVSQESKTVPNRTNKHFDLTTTDAVIRWQLRLKQEEKAAAEWKETWGFLEKEPINRHQLDDRSDMPTKSKLDCQLERMHLDAKQKYKRPFLSSHVHGWRPSLEIYGVAHFGMRNGSKEDLMHDVSFRKFGWKLCKCYTVLRLL